MTMANVKAIDPSKEHGLHRPVLVMPGLIPGIQPTATARRKWQDGFRRQAPE
jgi:hypothetical protein